MTRLEIGGRAVRREVVTTIGRSRFPAAYVVELRPEGVMIREKGRRTWYGPVSYGAVFLMGAKQKADAERAERLARRKLRRMGRAA